jgi:hypothetical protein
VDETPDQREARLLAEAQLEAEIDHKHRQQEAIQAKEETEHSRRPVLGIANAVQALFRAIRP